MMRALVAYFCAAAQDTEFLVAFLFRRCSGLASEEDAANSQVACKTGVSTFAYTLVAVRIAFSMARAVHRATSRR